MEESYFNLTLKKFFSQYYYNTSEEIIKINGVAVNLSIKTQTFNPFSSNKLNYFIINEKKIKRI